jgi:patatin-like phospholipase/acyl hydrolase
MKIDKKKLSDYQRMCCRVFSLKLTRNNDPEMIAHLESKDNVQGYIKSLIKADMEKEERGALEE